MSPDLHELLQLYALGILDHVERGVVERAVAVDPALAAELSSYESCTDQLVQPVAPPPDVKLRLLASVGGGRYEPFAGRMSALFGVPLDQARACLGLIERPRSWSPQIPGIEMVHFDGGPAYPTADCGFVRLAPGTIFPPHTHLGEETSIVLAGTIRDLTSSQLFHPGEGYVHGTGSEHALRCEGTEPCMFAVRAIDGIAVAGVTVHPR